MNGRRVFSCTVLSSIFASLLAAAQAQIEQPAIPLEQPADAAEQPATQVERPTGPVESCVTTKCHTKEMAGRVLHGPTAQKQCDACHVVTDVQKHTYGLIVPKTELCSYCHTQSERSVVHKPVTDRECDKCHDPHGSDYPLQLLGDPSGSLCFPCHKPEEYGGLQHIDDRVVVVGACDVCHESHSSWMPMLLPKEVQELCMFCHESLRSRLELIGRSHAPVMDGRCLDCHDAHTTEHPGQLRKGAPQLCYLCHEHDNIRTLVETSPFVHGALTTKESCHACHIGHGSVLPALLAGPEKGLCLSCHDEPLAMKDGRVLIDLAGLLKENPRHHGPIRDGECAPCHDSHASMHGGLLTKAYPDFFYASFDTQAYALCFECHIENLVVLEQGIGVTEFRDKERSLHFVHVNKPKRGRTCGACHDVHASARSFHMRETASFGPRGWEIEINHMKLPNGGRCAPGCHEARSYDRGEGEMPKAPRAGLKPDKLE
ncbi:MAG: cytochrome c3 family protein [Planctomycetota bacterium]|jgi:predicted CXXCH cytochrome family protein